MERIIRDGAGLGKHGFASYNAQTNKALGTSQQGTSQLGEPPDVARDERRDQPIGYMHAAGSGRSPGQRACRIYL